MMPILKSPSKCNDDDDFVQPRPPVHRPNWLSLKKRPKEIFPLDETTAKYSQDLRKAVEGSHFQACYSKFTVQSSSYRGRSRISASKELESEGTRFGL
jgi:hypothetical protein